MFEAVIEPNYEGWHQRARALVTAGVAPADVVWTERKQDQPLLGGLAAPLPDVPSALPLKVPRRFVEMAKLSAHHRSAERWSVLYRVLWRIVRGERRLLDDELDEDARQLRALVRAVKEDAERMKAFVRFRSIGPQGAEHFIAWHRPDHDVTSLVAPHFADRYPNMQWSIFTPFSSAHWDGKEIRIDRGVPADAIPTEDSNRAAETLWRTYYAAAFNPARVNESKLRRDMPQRFRQTLPEGGAIPLLVAEAPLRAETLRHGVGGVTSRALVPPTNDLEVLRSAVANCTGCDLFRQATHAVFGEGPPNASIVLVGEQPGDAEDRAGRPFVGPAGELLDRALAAAGIVRSDVYVTNAVKHFAWEPRGKRRIHRTPRLSEVRACRPWVEAELASVAPRVIVCLGGTAAQALLGPQARVNALRGRILTGHSWAPAMIVTLHPAAVLRAEDPVAQDAAYASLVADLALAKSAVHSSRDAGTP